ncbi:hypothetical protein [Aquimarina algiphila]|uniref:hypothetical protein n=1 Tax=Aquimarina algiphila TaxID=2047982 RepID=UPI00232C7E70|nr:hypothetical protein [Aquimarina algiphila]
MSKEHRIMRKMIKHFSGLNKLEAFDILQKMEVVLYYASSPLKTKDLEQIIVSGSKKGDEIDPFHFTFLPNGNLCEFVGSNEWLQIYQENNRFLPDWSMFRTYYYKTVYAPLELRKLTKNNLLKSLEGESNEQNVRRFLKNHRITKRDIITDRLLILDMLSFDIS